MPPLTVITGEVRFEPDASPFSDATVRVNLEDVFRRRCRVSGDSPDGAPQHLASGAGDDTDTVHPTPADRTEPDEDSTSCARTSI